MIPETILNLPVFDGLFLVLVTMLAGKTFLFVWTYLLDDNAGGRQSYWRNVGKNEMLAYIAVWIAFIIWMAIQFGHIYM